jgi:hypothetical protein
MLPNCMALYTDTRQMTSRRAPLLSHSRNQSRDDPHLREATCSVGCREYDGQSALTSGGDGKSCSRRGAQRQLGEDSEQPEPSPQCVEEV